VRRWSDDELVGMGEMPLHETEPEELLAFIRQLLVRSQAVELEERDSATQRAERALLERLLAEPRTPIQPR